MANSLKYQEKEYSIGDTIAVDYKIQDGDKFRIQQFAGILIKVRGADEATRMMTVRKMSKAGIGVERIFPVASPFIDKIELVKKTSYKKAKLYFVRDLSDKQMRRKLYHQKNK